MSSRNDFLEKRDFSENEGIARCQHQSSVSGIPLTGVELHSDPLMDGSDPGEPQVPSQQQFRSLDTIQPGRSAVVHHVTSVHGELARRLCSLGIVANCVIEVLGVAPFGDPIQVRANRTQLSLRKSEAQSVVVQAA